MMLSRRGFIFSTATLVGGGALFGCGRSAITNPLRSELETGAIALTAFLIIQADNSLQIAIPRAEMGQGVTTTLATIVAEELDVSLPEVSVIHPPASALYANIEGVVDAAPFAPDDDSVMANGVRWAMSAYAKSLGMQMTGASSSARDMWEPLRQAGAYARAALLQEAAHRLKVPTQVLTLSNKHVVFDDARFTFAELASGAAARSVEAQPKPASQWRLIGKSLPRIDTREKSQGKALYAIDTELPDMLYATMRQSPTLGGTVVKADLSIARQAKGVTKVLDMGDSIAVVAESYWQAKQALDAIEVTWSDANYPDSDELYTLYENLLNEAKEVETYRSDGPSQAELNEFTANDLQFDYFAPYQAHMTMEPLSCTIHYSKSGAQCWYGAQIPTAVVNQISSILELDRDKVELHVPYLGGGFGRRLEGDVAMFAARIAKQLPDRPIKLLWSREEDTTHGRYRPAAMARMRCRLNDDGLPVLFAGRTVVQPVWPKFTVRNMGEEDGTGSMDATIAFGLFDQPYNFQDYQMEAIDPKISFPVGQWRSVGNSYNAFFMESMLDEISIKTDTDPFELRRQLLKHDPVALSVLNAVKQMSGWDDLPKTQGWGRGIAFSRCFGTCTAQVVSLHVDQNRVRVAKVFCAADPGPAINPDVVISQIEGGIIFGLSSALLQEITIHAGVVQQSNFDQHPALRINQAPEIKVRLLSGQTEIGGVGEIGVPAVIPAVTSAIFNAVNIRVRRLPITHSGLSLA